MATFCPSCGASIKKDDQKYCQDCGTTLPDARARNLPAVRGQSSPAGLFRGGTGAVDSPSGMILGLVPDTLKNRMLMYAGGFVVAVVAVWVVVGWIRSYADQLDPGIHCPRSGLRGLPVLAVARPLMVAMVDLLDSGSSSLFWRGASARG